jgi:sugar phosphate isomerase/epimerase
VITRRSFTEQSLAALGLTALPPTAEKLGTIGIQLYTVRDLLANNFEGTLASLAAAGYREVEFAGYHKLAPAVVRGILDRRGLAAPSAHVDMSDIRTRWPQTLDAAKEVGHKYLVLAYLDRPDRHSLDSYRRVAADLNKAAAAAKAVGIEVAYHNHDFEFAPIDGQVPYDVFLAETDRTLVKLELDLYWATKGGADPVAYFNKWPGRFPLVHIKDVSKDPTRSMVDLGTGRIDFKRIFQKARLAGIKHYFVEHDQPKDALVFARKAIAYLKNLEF